LLKAAVSANYDIQQTAQISATSAVINVGVLDPELQDNNPLWQTEMKRQYNIVSYVM